MLTFVKRFRQREYTGENRCIPCTVINVFLAVGVAIGVSVFAAIVGPPLVATAIGAAVVIFSLTIIYVRGYLVPGTPSLTARYLPDVISRKYGPEHSSVGEPEAEASLAEQGTGIGVDAEAELISAGALETCAERDDLCLTDSFRTAWRERIDTGVDHHRFLNTLQINGDEVTINQQGGGFRVFVDGDYVGTWESKAAYNADVASAEVLAGQLSRWEELPTVERSKLLSALRLFIERCPSCGGVVELGTETVESCCTSRKVSAVSCNNCGARLFETPIESTPGDM